MRVSAPGSRSRPGRVISSACQDLFFSAALGRRDGPRASKTSIK